MSAAYDALLIVSFGGPEGPEDVLPFLENVLRGRNVPHERLRAVAEHYQSFGGISPINEQNRRLIRALEQEFREHGPALPVYWGNRNWHPMLEETIRQMKKDGINSALAFVTSAYSSYSSCRQYRENIEAARDAVGVGAPHIEKLRAFYNHPLFVEANILNVQAALEKIPQHRRSHTILLFTAHSIPQTMAANCAYELQLEELARLISSGLDHSRYVLVYQSRSGPSTQPWLEPDVCDELRSLHTRDVTDVVVAPIGFVSDHMEIIYDLDTQARQVCEEFGINMVRSNTVGTHPFFISMIRELVLERVWGTSPRYVGGLGPVPDLCPADCCLSGSRA
jgi:ferrochelatase